MEQSVKSKTFKMVDNINDENFLRMVMEDVAFYAGKQDVTDELNEDQLKEFDAAVKVGEIKTLLTGAIWKRKLANGKKDSHQKDTSNPYRYKHKKDL